MELEKITDGKNFEIVFFPGNLVYLRYLDDCCFDLEVMTHLIEDLLVPRLGDKPFYSIANMANVYGNVTDEAKYYITNHPVIINQRKCEAYIVNSIPVKMMVAFYLKVVKSPTPSKVFRRIEDCEEWVKSFGVSNSDWDLLIEDGTLK